MKSKEFCPIPFIQLQLNPLGNVSACCYSGEHKVGNVSESTIEEIWNGEEMKRWRREFLSGDIQICAKAMKTFACHKQYQHLNANIELREHQTILPRKLDLRLNGQCNLECVMCDVWRQPNHIYDSSDFWTVGPEKIFPHLLEVDVLGGEPFIQKDVYRFIDEVLRTNLKCNWGFITNCNYKFTPKLAATLDRLRLRHIHMSLDSVRPETYSKIRKRGDLSKTLQTVEAFVNYRKKRVASGGDYFALFGSMCVQRLNCREIPEFLDFCQERDIQPILQNVIAADDLALKGLSRREKEDVLWDLKPLLSGTQGNTVRPLFAEIQSLLRA